MKKVLTLLIFFSVTHFAFTQSEAEKAAVSAACMNYIEGFYEGDTLKLISCLKPSLNKFGFWKDKTSGEYGDPIHMTFERAKAYARNVLEKKEFPAADAPRKVVVLDMMDHIASAKVTAWWGSDYILLSKSGGKWMIEQVLWEGPLKE